MRIQDHSPRAAQLLYSPSAFMHQTRYEFCDKLNYNKHLRLPM